MLLDMKNPKLAQLIPADGFLEPISVGYAITEGIIWNFKTQRLVFSDMSLGKVYQWDPQTKATSVIKTPSNISNGNFIDAEGRVVSCEHATSSIVRMEHDGRYLKVLASHYQGKEFNSPNDIIIDSQNRIWFTDPIYGRKSEKVGITRPSELGYQGVYRLDPDGSVHLVSKDFDQPNGLCMELGEKSLLVNDTPRKHIRRFAVEADGSLSGGAVIAEIAGEGPGSPDGLKIDCEGNIYCTGPGGIFVFSPDGTSLGRINMPEHTRNFCFGDEDRGTLYLAGSTTIYRLRTNTFGVKYF